MGIALKRIPPLESGDHLDAYEFERRYGAMPWLKRAELIQGVVYLPSPVRAEGHGKEHARVVTWLGAYQAATPVMDVIDNSTLRVDDQNRPQPDAAAYVKPECGGRVRIDQDGYLAGSPELIAEISASSASFDVVVKTPFYKSIKVQELLTWKVLDEELNWYALRRGRYAPLMPDSRGVIRSQVFPGLWLNVPALLKDDVAKVLRTLQRGLKTPEHKAFVARLRAAGK